MLHPLYGLREKGIMTEYDHPIAQKAVSQFLEQLDEGRRLYLAGIRRMYSSLYGEATRKAGKRRFLDKTPRYYLVLSELFEVFPDAQYVFLLRNPMDVMVSVMRTWVGENIGLLEKYRLDLLDAPERMIQGLNACSNAIVVHYEDLVRKPYATYGELLDELDLEPYEGGVEYGDADLPRWNLGDKRMIYQHSRPDASSVDRWQRESKENAQVWRFLWDYLSDLGADTLRALGYDPGLIRRVLTSHRPSRWRRWSSVPMYAVCPAHELGRKNRARIALLRLMDSCGERTP